MDLKWKVAVIGAGSAGVTTVCRFIADTPDFIEVHMIHNPDIDIIGIGESTNPVFVNALEDGTDFRMYTDLSELNGTIKHGTLYKDWRNHDILNPLLGSGVALHFDTHKLMKFAIPRLKKRWGSRFTEVHGNVESLENKGEYVEVAINGNMHNYDYVFDCRGFPDSYDDYQMVESLVNHGLIHNKKEPADWGVTGHRATPNGWMFEIPLTERQSFGYMYNDNITSNEEAKKDFARTIGVNEKELDGIEYHFNSYYTKQFCDGRIFRNGNRAAFFEPMFANSLYMYNTLTELAHKYIRKDMGYTLEDINEYASHLFRSVHDMIMYTYHGGSIYDTEFWNNAIDLATEKLYNSIYFKQTVNNFKEIKDSKSSIVDSGLSWIFTYNSLRQVDKDFGYNYFKWNNYNV